MLIYQDTDERHTALIAAVNNNDAKVEVFTFDRLFIKIED